MYAVGLGAAILTQYRLEDGSVVRVLADGGMGHGGYPPDYVLQQLPTSWDAFDGAGEELGRRLDLIVGTHYDGDHLKGLIPIAKDPSIEIGEVWLPPVKDDTDEVPGHLSESSGYLANVFYDDTNERELLRYLEAQLQQVEALQEAEEAVLTALTDRRYAATDRLELPHYRVTPALRPSRFIGRLQTAPPLTSRDYLRYFEVQARDASERTGGESAHSAATYDSSVEDIRDLARAAVRSVSPASLMSVLTTRGFATKNLARLRLMPAMLASIRKSTAAKAITASHLHKLVQALKARRTPVRPQCHYITAGRPMRFVWNSAKKRFIPRSRGGPSAIVLTLLGPSHRLVEKHREKLPVGSYLYALSMVRGPLKPEHITESNQLSYILTVEAAGQRLLISGDAGCYDFQDDDGVYWPPLLDALKPLHVVQIAHHAGHNYDFYDTLRAAGFAGQTEPAWLLLSHGVEDPKRPSAAFSHFMSDVRREGDDVCLLFTSEPTADKVADYDELIAPVVPGGNSADQGDVRLSFRQNEAKSGWVVEKHAVEV
jgi:glyoxylase-like metal-dependent hydrolase (beta-lactamase superfamily II)